MEKEYWVWACSDTHSTYRVCHSYKEALKVRKQMCATLRGDYTFSIEKKD